MIVAFTGHRPDKLGGYKLPNPTYIKVCREIDKALKELKPEKVITGMALGVDQWAANIAHKLHIPYLAAIPFENQECKWPEASQRIFRILRKLASEEVIVSEGEYAAHKMQVRNEWMVDHCDVLIAIWDGSKGGTGNCVEYAKSVNKKIIYINPKD
ncbi:MAG TPA: SLOG family protein [Candidatus Saccharimonadales bacterium]